MIMAFVKGIPHVNFEINKEMDYWAVKEFLTFDPEDSFSNSILFAHPNLNGAKSFNYEERIDFYNKYVDQVYENICDVLAQVKTRIQENWDTVETEFLEKTQKIFMGHPWPEGAYVGFLSIFNCNPRFLNQKTFQVYYEHPEGPVYVCAHEMLHFMFYDYLEKHPELVEGFSEALIWYLSEIFNVVILETPEFVKITGNSNPQPYKKHVEFIPKFRGLWKSEKDVFWFIKNGLELLQSLL